MLTDFQQALADATASPALCMALRARPELLDERYDLTARESARLLGILRHPGMSAACTVYRMNRLAPLAMNLRGTLRALGTALREVIDAYWAEHPRGHAHFYIESARFVDWLSARIEAGMVVAEPVADELRREGALVGAALRASRTEPAGIPEPGPDGAPLA